MHKNVWKFKNSMSKMKKEGGAAAPPSLFMKVREFFNFHSFLCIFHTAATKNKLFVEGQNFTCGIL